MKAFYHDKMEREKQSIMRLLNPGSKPITPNQMGKRGVKRVQSCAHRQTLPKDRDAFFMFN